MVTGYIMTTSDEGLSITPKQSCRTMANLENPADLENLVVVEGVVAEVVAEVEVDRGIPMVKMAPVVLMVRLVGVLLIQEMPVILADLAEVAEAEAEVGVEVATMMGPGV
jgi:hypothetical protein